MSDRKTKTLVQVGILLLISGALLTAFLLRRNYTPPNTVGPPPSSFVLAPDGRTLVDEDNGFTIAVPDQWVGTKNAEIPNVIDLHHERADVICDIEVAHGKNVTGTSASGFLSVFDPGNHVTERFRDSIIEIRPVVGVDAAYLGWTGESSNIRHREVYLPYQGYLLTLRFSEDLSPDAFGRQPVPCITIFSNLIESGITLP